MTSSDLQRDMIACGIHFSNTLIKRHLIKAGRVARRPLTKQLLTKKMKSKRLCSGKRIQKLDFGWL